MSYTARAPILAAAALAVLAQLSCRSTGAPRVASPARLEPRAEDVRRPEAPFGFEKGMTLAQLRVKLGGRIDDAGEGMYFSRTAPRMDDPEVESFGLWFDEAGALCAVMVLGKQLEVEPSGEALRRAFDAHRQSLTEMYGPAYVINRSKVLAHPKSWMQALHDDDRRLAALWSPNANSTLPADLARITLFARARSSVNGVVAILYHFTATGSRCAMPE